ncbi:MAG: MFS transporter [Luteolibacter sp.]
MGASSKPSPLPVYLLSAAGFTVLTTEFVIVGLLPSMARDLKVSVPHAGLLVTLFAFTVAAFGPPLTAFLSAFERKRLFVFTLLLLGISNTIAALAPNMGVMAFARFIPALILPVYWSLASETVMEISGPGRAGKGISTFSLGPVLATVFGIPIGTLLADCFNWRTAFTVLAALSFIKGILLGFYLPKLQLVARQASFLRQFTILRSPVVLGNVLLSLLVFSGMFTAYTYLADMLEKLGKFDGSIVGWLLMAFGGVGLIGNWLGGRLVDRSAFGATHLFCILMAVAVLFLNQSFHSLPLLGLVLVVWGISQSALFPISHVRVMKTAAAYPALGASLNISGANIGIGLGALIGGHIIEIQGLSSLGGAAAGVLLIAIGVTLSLQLAARPKTAS